MKNAHLSFIAPTATRDALYMEAERVDRPASWLIRRALDLYLEDVAAPETRERPLTRTLDAGAQAAPESLHGGDA